MGQAGDRMLGRRESWVGAAVRDLQPGSRTYGQYFRVAISERDPNSDQWGIYWRIVEDRLPGPPEGEPVYRFDGTTWDLPAYAATVHSKAWTYFCLGAAGLMTLLAPAFWTDSTDVVGVIALSWFVAGFAIVWDIFFKVEPVRGTKVSAALIAASAAHKAATQADIKRMNDEYNASSGILQYIDDLTPEEARKYGVTQRRPR